MKEDKAGRRKALIAGFRQAGALTKKHAQTFYFASHFLPKEKKDASYAVYAICRLSDEAVDGPQPFSPEKKLNNIRTNIEAAYQDLPIEGGLLLAFQETIRRHQIPKKYFLELLEGMKIDLKRPRYENFAQLYDYCYKAAGVVGLIMLNIFGYRNREAKRYAVDLGIAMQLTNILRDIKEDYARGRIYLPQDEMERFGTGANDISKQKLSDNFIKLLKFQIERARKYYRSSAAGIKLISHSRCRLVLRAMKEMYAAILKAIENNNYDVFSQRAHVNTKEKVIILSKVILDGGRNEN
jgi:phytoene synthase